MAAPIPIKYRETLIDAQRTSDKLREQPQLANSGSDGQPPGMETEIALLKQRADQADQRMARMEGKLDQISDALRALATKDDVKRAESAAWNALGVGGGVALALVALLVGILTYLQDQRIAARPEAPPAAAAPMILQLPPWPTPAASPATPPPATPPG